MQTATTNVIARVAAALAGLGLVASAFAPMAMAQTTTTTTVATTTTATFTRDLTIGSTGADVTALQNWLISKGHTIAAGATGYFGSQTQAALAAYQAANGISPAAGYFGPITRAKVATTGGSTTTTGGTTTTTTTLSGDEADLSDFNLRREESTGNEGEEEVEVFTVEFDVEDGDILVERMEITASSSNNSTLNDRPWDYFDRVTVWVDGDEVADMDVDNRDEWDEGDEGVYVLDITGLDIMVEEGDMAEITVAFDIASSIDTGDLDQDFIFYIEDEGIRAVDAEGIQQYTGDDSETVTFGFGGEESGDLRIRSNSDSPDATTLIADEDDESQDYTVFAFDLENQDDVDVELLDITVDVSLSSTTLDADDVLRRATLVVDGEEIDGDIGADAITFEDVDFEIGGDEEITVELMVTLVRDAGNTGITFSIDEDGIDAEGVESGDDAEVGGSATSEDHTIATDGVMVTADRDDNRSDSDKNDDGTVGTFRVTFSVEALEEDAYIARGAGSALASSTDIRYVVYEGNTASTTVVSSAVVQSDADVDGDFFLVEEGQTEEFTITVTVDPGMAGTYYVELDAVRFDDVKSPAGSRETYTVPDGIEFESEAVSLSA